MGIIQESLLAHEAEGLEKLKSRSVNTDGPV